jgi:hypothetical protein
LSAVNIALAIFNLSRDDRGGFACQQFQPGGEECNARPLIGTKVIGVLKGIGSRISVTESIATALEVFLQSREPARKS